MDGIDGNPQSCAGLDLVAADLSNNCDERSMDAMTGQALTSASMLRVLNVVVGNMRMVSLITSSMYLRRE